MKQKLIFPFIFYIIIYYVTERKWFCFNFYSIRIMNLHAKEETRGRRYSFAWWCVTELSHTRYACKNPRPRPQRVRDAWSLTFFFSNLDADQNVATTTTTTTLWNSTVTASRRRSFVIVFRITHMQAWMRWMTCQWSTVCKKSHNACI